MSGSEKSVTILLGQKELSLLKSSKYKLCFAKKVGDTFNVVWQSYKDYLGNNTFSWTPAFELFGQNTFQNGIQVRAQTNLVGIGLGQTCTLDPAGNLQKPVSGGPAISLTLDNQYGPIHPGVNQLSTGIDGAQTSSAIYVAENPVVKGPTELTPKEEVLVWFEQNVETGTMFSSSRSNSVSIDMTTTNAQTRQYQNGTWITPSDGLKAAPQAMAMAGYGDAGALPPIRELLQVMVTVVGSVTAASILERIAARLTGVYRNIDVDVVIEGGNTFRIVYFESPQQSHEASFSEAVVGSRSTANTLLEFAIDALTAENASFQVLNASA